MRACFIRSGAWRISVAYNLYFIQLFQLRFFPEQSRKVEYMYEREKLLGIANKLFPAAFRARIRLFRFAGGTTLMEIAVCVLHVNFKLLYLFCTVHVRYYNVPPKQLTFTFRFAVYFWCKCCLQTVFHRDGMLWNKWKDCDAC